MGNSAIIWTFAGVLAAACFARGLNLRAQSAVAELGWYTLGAFFLAGAVVIWISMEKEMLVQHKLVLGCTGAVFGALATLFVGQLVHSTVANAQAPAFSPPTVSPMPRDNNSNDVTGAEIVGNNQGGASVEVLSSGDPGQPSVGMDITTRGDPGQNVTGLRVIQNGPGTGLKVIQTGPGVGVRSTVIVGPNNN